MQKQVAAIRKRGGRARKAITWLATALLGRCRCFLKASISHGNFWLFVGFTVLVVLAGAVLVAVGILFHWAGQGLASFVRGVKRMAPPKQVAAERYAGAFVDALHD